MPQKGEEEAAFLLLPLSESQRLKEIEMFNICKVTQDVQHWAASNSDITNFHLIYASDHEQQALYRFDIIECTLKQTKFLRGTSSSTLIRLDGCGVLFKLTRLCFPTHCLKLDLESTQSCFASWPQAQTLASELQCASLQGHPHWESQSELPGHTFPRGCNCKKTM